MEMGYRGVAEGALRGCREVGEERAERLRKHLLPADASRVGHVLGCAFLSTSIMLRSATLK